jgi:hypothetical protein
VLHLRLNFRETDANVPALVRPGDFDIGFDSALGSGQREGYALQVACVESIVHADLQSALAEIDQLRPDALLLAAA